MSLDPSNSLFACPPAPSAFDAPPDGDPAEESLSKYPLVSVLLPVRGAPDPRVNRAIESVVTQDYPLWQLCVACDGSANLQTRQMLEEWSARDLRIVVRFLAEPGDLSRVANAALEMCRGEITAFLSPGDELPAKALFHLARKAASHPDGDVILSGSEAIEDPGRQSAPIRGASSNLEGGFPPRLRHLEACRTDRLRETGGFGIDEAPC
ncbi:MAG: glycosyltransferase [Verrucomicrobia bacterium]|nr:glycosyltransferase [Verrucomicrobiota bacterium]